MKFKTTAIAIAVAGTVAAPVAVQAGADEIYASARVGVEYVDNEGTADTNIRSYSSRFGAKGETDLGNGLIGYGKYEWDVDEDDFSIRHRVVGLKGDWGNAFIGKTYHTFFNFVVGPTDTPYWNANFAQISYTGRTDDAVTYAGGSGSFAFGATAYMSRDTDEETVDSYEGGASFTFGNDMVIGLGVQATAADQDDVDAGGEGRLINGSDETVVGATFHGIQLGEVSLGVSGMVQDDDSSAVIDVTYGGLYVHFEGMAQDKDSPANPIDDDRDIVGLTVGYSHSLGRKTTMWYEINAVDQDTNNSDDDVTQVQAVLRYDII
jgi:predicted porin